MQSREFCGGRSAASIGPSCLKDECQFVFTKKLATLKQAMSDEGAATILFADLDVKLSDQEGILFTAHQFVSMVDEIVHDECILLGNSPKMCGLWHLDAEKRPKAGRRL